MLARTLAVDHRVADEMDDRAAERFEVRALGRHLVDAPCVYHAETIAGSWWVICVRLPISM